MTGSPLNDKHVNLAQMLLKYQFPKLHGFYSTSLQHKESLKRVTVGVQIMHINDHWLTAAKFSPDEPLKVYDSVNLSVTNQIKCILNVFEFSEIRMVAMQKQKENNICGLYAIATATAILHGKDPNNLQFKEDQMRNHLCKCLEDGFLSLFPTL